VPQSPDQKTDEIYVYFVFRCVHNVDLQKTAEITPKPRNDMRFLFWNLSNMNWL
jgi:hypothetical protein